MIIPTTHPFPSILCVKRTSKNVAYPMPSFCHAMTTIQPNHDADGRARAFWLSRRLSQKPKLLGGSIPFSSTSSKCLQIVTFVNRILRDGRLKRGVSSCFIFQLCPFQDLRHTSRLSVSLSFLWISLKCFVLNHRFGRCSPWPKSLIIS